MTNPRWLKLVAFLLLLAPVGGRAAQNVSGDVAGEAARLYGRRWHLTEVDGDAVRATRAYVEFDRAARRLNGDGGCNRISGGFEADDSRLRLSRIISTRRACLDAETQRVETNLLQRLERTDRFRIQGGALRLYAGDALVLTFRAEAGDAPREPSVKGTVTYRQRSALPWGAVVEVRLLEVSRPGARPLTITRQVIRPAGRQVPIPFELRYDPGRIRERRRYAVEARILVGGRLWFTNAETYPVLTGGHPDTAEVVVNPVRR